MEQLSSTLIYTFLGLAVFVVALIFMEVVTKFSIRHKVAEDGNIAVAIVLASIIASLGMIISSAIQ
jgi:uncharacterized membrane protein YjfL (UPF0719 family)